MICLPGFENGIFLHPKPDKYSLMCDISLDKKKHTERYINMGNKETLENFWLMITLWTYMAFYVEDIVPCKRLYYFKKTIAEKSFL